MMEGLFEALLNAILEPLLSFLGAMLWVVGQALLEVLAEMIFQPLFCFLAHGLAVLLRYGVACPLACVFCTPMVLAHALSGPGGYLEKVLSEYRTVCDVIVHPRRWW